MIPNIDKILQLLKNIAHSDKECLIVTAASFLIYMAINLAEGYDGTFEKLSRTQSDYTILFVGICAIKWVIDYRYSRRSGSVAGDKFIALAGNNNNSIADDYKSVLEADRYYFMCCVLTFIPLMIIQFSTYICPLFTNGNPAPFLGFGTLGFDLYLISKIVTKV